MKKSVQIAFAVALLIISIMATIIQSQVFENIIYSVVVPSFLLSLISFLSEIGQKCEDSAAEYKKLHEDLGNLTGENAQQKLDTYEHGSYKQPFVENLVPKEIYIEMDESLNHLKKALLYTNVKIFLSHCKTFFDIANIVSYVLLFLSLILAPYIIAVVSLINMNCITLWSLTLLYFSVELKPEICKKCFSLLLIIFKKKQKHTK